ncbi:E3 ubiquitin-protein ligase RNF135 isoform X1 [Candoia aspera]|uniref:E3 ubiquitin-protein ligase RNF135 isoform X1 n=1 Tax=Candoia aspera TaxID=51853 RepID=UPI002FD84CE7
MASAADGQMPVWLKAEDLQCSICLGLLSNPATMQCGHSFCLGCIQKWLKGQHGNRNCPICKCGLGDKLPERNVLLELVLERYKCASSSDQLPLQGSWRLAQPGFPDGSGCKRDFATDRRGFQDTVKISEIPKQIQMVLETITTWRKDSAAMKDYMSQTRSSISEAFGFMKKCICDQEEMVLGIIEEELIVAQQITDSTDKQLTGKIHNLLDLQINSEEVMKNTSSEQEAYIGNPIQMNAPPFSIQKISSIASVVEEFRRQLEASVLRDYRVQPLSQKHSPGTSNSSEIAADVAEDMFFSCNSSLSKDSVQETSSSSSAVPSTRDGELPMISNRFSPRISNITFDDERLGCMLELAGNKRKVIVSRIRRQYERSPKRFCNSQVLGSQSFSEGCHYWEVSTKESSGWAIGVASGEIGRKDRLGRNELSWCIEWNTQCISAWHNNQEEKITEEKPLQVGVFLDFPTKSLSFYSLTDKETCLHKFQINTANPVYPAFWIYGLTAGEFLSINDISRH